MPQHDPIDDRDEPSSSIHADPLGFVISRNLARRHLSESQRAMVAAELAKMTRADAGRLGGKAGEATPDLGLLPTPVAPVSVQQAADMLNVGRGTVEAAKKVIRDGVPELTEAVKSGGVSVSAAAEIAKAPAEEQAAIVALPADERVEVLKAKRAEAKAIRASLPTKSEAKRIAKEPGGFVVDRTGATRTGERPWICDQPQPQAPPSRHCDRMHSCSSAILEVTSWQNSTHSR